MRYDSYAETSLPWLKDIPSHWKLLRNKNFLSESKTVVGDMWRDYTLLSLTKGGIIPRDVSSGKGKFPSDFGSYKVVQQGDIVFCLFDIDETPRTVGLSSHDGMLTGAYNIFRINNINPRFFLYYYLSLDTAKAFKPLYTGLRKTIKTSVFLGTKLPVPPQEEQDQIVCYLDWQVSKINKLIAARKKQITLLKELRKAITDEGILRGFTSSEMKDSGVLWLGSVPEHWSVKPLKRVCRVNASIAHLTTALNDDTRVTFLPMENVSVIGEVDCTIKKPLSEVRSGFSSFAKGDVVVAKITPCFENGKGACLDSLDTEIGFGTTEFINLRPSHDINPKYLYLITMTRPFRVLGEKVMTGSAGQKRVSPEYIKNFTIGIPPFDEQNNILEEIDRRVSRIVEQIRCENESISVLFELRTRLISDVVTGKIDVRGIEVPDFDIVEEIDSDDENLDDEDAAEETEEQEE